MTCENALERISAALDGELTLEEKAELDRHLAQCDACRALFDDLTSIHGACGHLDVAPPADLKARIMENLPPQTVAAQKKTAKVTFIHWKRWTAMAASFALIALAAWHLPRLATVPQPTPTNRGDKVQSVETSTSAPASTEPTAGFAAPEAAMDSSEEPQPTSLPDSPPEDTANTSIQFTAKEPSNAAPQIDTSEAAPAANTGGAYGGADSDHSAETDEVVNLDGLATEEVDLEASKQALLFSSARMATLPTEISLNEDNAVLKSASPIQGGSGGGSSSVPSAGAADAIPEPHPELADGENVAATLFTGCFDVEAPSYCGVLTLRSGAPLGGYPAEVRENGETWYFLPHTDFYALVSELKNTETDFDLRVTGNDVSATAQTGLVIVLP